MARGPKKTQRLGFKATEAMRLFVEEQSTKQGDVGYSAIMRQAAELYRDLYERLGAELWHEADKRAGVNGQSLGTVFATIVRHALEQERKTKK